LDFKFLEDQELIVVTTDRQRRYPTGKPTTSTTTTTTTTTTRLDRINSGNQVLLKARKMSGNKKTYSANRTRAKVQETIKRLFINDVMQYVYHFSKKASESVPRIAIILAFLICFGHKSHFLLMK